MAKSKTTRTRRHPVEEGSGPFMTLSEARAEAVFLVLEALLPRLSQSVCKSVMAYCYSEADSIGDDAITEEVEFLFHRVRFEPPTR
jgi:hypothetical protein